MRSTSRLCAVCVIGTAAAGVVLSAHAIIGPTSSESPYLLRAEPGVVSVALLSTGDSVNGYRMAGIPDGLGAFDNGDGTFTVLMNHEMRETQGITRAHGAKGAFVSRWTVRKDDLAVIDGRDLIQQVATWNTGLGAWNEPAKGVVMSRFCSADLAPASALFDAQSGFGPRAGCS